MINSILDLQKPIVKDVINDLVINKSQKVCLVFNKLTGDLIEFYLLTSFLSCDEQNRKSFFIKGKPCDVFSLTQKPNWQLNFNQELERISEQKVTFSENMFGFVLYGLTEY